MGGCGSVEELANIYATIDKDENNINNNTLLRYGNESFIPQPLLSQQTEAPPKDAMGILKHVNSTALNLMLTLKNYRGDHLLNLIQVGRNESAWQPIRNVKGIKDKWQLLFSGKTGLRNIIAVINLMIKGSKIDLDRLTSRNLFPNDVIALIILFSIIDHPKVQAFKALAPTAMLCMNIPISCEYIGEQLSSKVLQVFASQIENANEITTSKVISQENTELCRELMVLFEVLLGLDEYKMRQQKYLTNNFTAYKRLHGDFLNARTISSPRGGGFAAFKAAKNGGNSNSNSNNKRDIETMETLAKSLGNDEIIPVAQVSDIAMFMGGGSTACLDKIADSMTTSMDAIQNRLLSQFANGCFIILKMNANSKENRNEKIVKHALTILRAMCALLLILDRRKATQNNYNSVFGTNEKTVKTFDCCRVFTQNFVQWYGDEQSISLMDGVASLQVMQRECKYCRQIIKLNSTGFRAGREFIRNKIYTLME